MRSKQLYIWFWLVFWVWGVCACSKDMGWDSLRNYNAGKQAFNDVENNMAVFMSFFDLSLRMNAYLQIPEEGIIEAEAYYFPEYRISRLKEDEWAGLKDQDTVFRIVKDDLALTTETANWKIYSCDDMYKGAVSVVCSGPRSWQLGVKAVENRMWRSDAHLKIQYNGEQVPENFSQSDWTVSGAGESIAEDGSEEVKMGFEVAESLIRMSGSRYLFDKGVLYMKIRREDMAAEEMIKADLRLLPGKKRDLQITYKGELYSYTD